MEVSGVVALSDETGVPLLSNLLAGEAMLEEPARRLSGTLGCRIEGKVGCKLGGRPSCSSRRVGTLS